MLELDREFHRPGWLSPMLGWSSIQGPWAKLELGYRATDGFGLYGFGMWRPEELSAGMGARLEF